LYPLYATEPVYNFLIQSYPHLENLIEHKPLLPGVTLRVREKFPVQVTSYPVYHGESAVGASMLLFTAGHKRILFTGDMLSPLLRTVDYKAMHGTDLLVVDTNNRFPYPQTNHWSFSGDPGDPMLRSDHLRSYIENTGIDDMLRPHKGTGADQESSAYFSTLRKEYDSATQPFTILEFIKKIQPKAVMLVHYSGSEDTTCYGESILSKSGLFQWADETARSAGLETSFIIPSAGKILHV